MPGVGESLGVSGPGFLDAQGNVVDVQDRRTLVLQLPNVDGAVQSFND